jgi:type II secretory pathway component PulK
MRLLRKTDVHWQRTGAEPSGCRNTGSVCSFATSPDRYDSSRFCSLKAALPCALGGTGERRIPLARQRGSVLVIVLWIAFGLVSLALYFANSMNFELRASDNRVSALAADQAIEGAARYLNYLLTTQIANGSNGVFLTLDNSLCRAVPVGDSHFWLIGRDTNNPVGPGSLCFGLVDEASKLNLNTASSNAIVWLPRMTVDLTQAILDWRDTNCTGPTVTYYAMQQPPYQCKCEPFETVDELRLLYGADMDTLLGEDANQNGVLDPNETDDNQNGALDPGVLEYCTVYSREPNTASGGSPRINITSLGSSSSDLGSLLQTNFGAARADQILSNLGLMSSGPSRSPNGTGSNNNRSPGSAVPVSFTSPLQFYVRSGMTAAEFAQIFTNLTTTSATYIEGRVNVNTASAAVLACLAGGDTGVAQQLVNYRQANPNNLTSIAWIIDALGQSYPDALQALEAGDHITTQSYQFTADVAALGPYGRGYRRVKFVFDTSSGTPKIIYRQDLTYLGWALGKEVRQNWVLAKSTS